MILLMELQGVDGPGKSQEWTRLEIFSTGETFHLPFEITEGIHDKNNGNLLSSPQRRIEETYIRRIFTTFIQLMYKVFRDMETVMFPTK